MKLNLRSKKSIIVVSITAVVALSAAVFFYSTNNAQAQVENPIANVTSPSTTSSTPSTLPELPQPENPPEDPYEDVPIVGIGSIEIPAIGLNHELYTGVSLTVLNVGPSHWPGTALPGEYGNTVIAGHRVTHTRPFRNMDQLKDGDEIIVNTDTGSHVYKVTGRDIVYPEDIWIVDQKPGFTITLFACHPPGSAAQRYVIYGELVDKPFEIDANV